MQSGGTNSARPSSCPGTDTNPSESPQTQTEPASSEPPSGAQDETQDVLGRWVLEEGPFPSRYVLLRKDDKLIMEQTFRDGSSQAMEMVEAKSPLGRRLDRVQTNVPEDYWVINENGDLELRDDEGLYLTARKIPAGTP